MEDNFNCGSIVVILDEVKQLEFETLINTGISRPPKTMYEAMSEAYVLVEMISKDGENLCLRVKTVSDVHDVFLTEDQWAVLPIDQIPPDEQRRLVLFLYEKASENKDGWTGTINEFVECYARREGELLLIQYGGYEMSVKLKEGIALQ